MVHSRFGDCEIAVDFLEVPKKGHLLVIVDYYSKWPEVAFLSKTKAESVIKCMESRFRSHGLPEIVWHYILATRMAVTLNRLPWVTPFDFVGEPATLAQDCTEGNAEFELYVAATGVTDKLQKRALLLHLAGLGVREIFKTYPADVRGDDKEFYKAVKCLSDHFKFKKNVPLARQTLLSIKPNPGETINNFKTYLRTLAEHCDYGEEQENQVRDIVISRITNKELKNKLYRDDNLTLAKLLEIMSVYHHKDALILVPEEKVNRAVHNSGKGANRFNGKQQFHNRCRRCDKPGHIAKDCRVSKNHTCGTYGKQGHMEVCCHTKVENMVKKAAKVEAKANLETNPGQVCEI